MRAARLLGLGLCGVALAAAAPAARRVRPAPDWRTIITEGDRARIRDWRATWTVALAAARDGGNTARIAAEGELLEPDAALTPAAAPDGDYTCRVIKLGTQRAGAPTYVDYPGFSCRIAGPLLVKLDGPQRPGGRLWPLDPARSIFLGSMALGDETRPLDYGRDGERDMAGVFERVGPRRWRLVLPRPRWESVLDVIELVPKA